MKRFMVFLVLMALSVPLSMNLAVAGDEPAPLKLVKECVLFGRILGHRVLLYQEQQVAEPVYDLPEMTQIGGFEILNEETGEWHPLSLSEEGYFCANVGMGIYDLRGRDFKGQPYVIHTFNIPKGMAVNLGNFWVETCDPMVISKEGWTPYFQSRGWHEYGEAAGAVELRVKQVSTDEAYDDCEKWFAECHEEAYDYFSSVIARR